MVRSDTKFPLGLLVPGGNNARYTGVSAPTTNYNSTSNNQASYSDIK